MVAKAQQVDAPEAIVLTDKERAAGAYSPRNLQKVLGALHQDGLVVLKDAIDARHIDALNVKMCEDAEEIIADPTKEYNHGVKSNFLQRPPVNSPAHLHEDIYFNPFLLQVANAYLGHKPIWNWLTANTALSNTKGIRQPVHKDSAFDHPKYPYFFIANIPLCDFSVENGATEFWLGSHAHTTVADQAIATDPAQVSRYVKLGKPVAAISEEALEARRNVRPPVQPAVCRGDVMIRDLRLWHAGMPNESESHRVMLGLGYQSPSHPNYVMRCHLPASREAFFLGHAGDKVEVRANFYGDGEFASTKADDFFDLRPSYEDGEA